MSAVPKARKLTVAEYFALEEKAERRSEFFDGEMRKVAESSREHNAIVRNLIVEVGGRGRDIGYQVLALMQRVKVDRTGLYTYPDVLIVCGEPEYAPENRDTLTNPRVVIEVLSDSTERYDRTVKFRQYQQLPSVQEYVLVSQHEPAVERFTRQPDGSWGLVSFVGLEAELVLATGPVRVPLTDVYRGVEFPAPDPARPGWFEPACRSCDEPIIAGTP